MRRHSPALLFLAAFVAVINLAFRPPAAVFAEESPPCAPTPDTTAEAPSNASLPPDPPPATTEPSPAAQPAAVLTMSELLPDPVGKDADGEFIEVHNAGASASMHGWLIIDGKGKVFSLPDAPIASGGYLVFPFSATALTLTNTGGSLTLHSPQGATETVTYPSLKEGIAWAKDSGEFQETSSPTPGAANSISSPSPATPEAPPAPPPPPPQVTPPSVPPATEIPPPAPPAALTVRISEALPDPAGSDEAEFIELENTGDVAASLDGWQLDDAEGGSRPYTFPSQTVIAARGFLLISHAVSDLVLNNTSDSIRLIDPSGTVRDSTQYADPKENASWSRGSDGTFDWTQQTPGAANATPASAAAAEMSASENDAEAVEDAVEEVAIAELWT